MIRVVIFDMFETLVSHYYSPLYFGSQMAADANILEDRFQSTWKLTECDRTIGKMTLEQALEIIFKENDCYSQELLRKIIKKRKESKEACFRHINSEIIPMLTAIKKKGIHIGLISNCFSEEVEVIRKSELFPYFDGVYLSYEQGIEKPNEEIFTRCMRYFSSSPEECLYVGDGGSYELETARKLGMKVIQAAWYLQEESTQPSKRNDAFIQVENPMGVLQYT